MGRILPHTTQCPTLLAAGDRLHFGLAVEQAKAEGLKVDMLVVGDDCALASKHLVGRRGVAGTVLVLKASWSDVGTFLPGLVDVIIRDAQASLVQHSSRQADMRDRPAGRTAALRAVLFMYGWLCACPSGASVEPTRCCWCSLQPGSPHRGKPVAVLAHKHLFRLSCSL